MTSDRRPPGSAGRRRDRTLPRTQAIVAQLSQDSDVPVLKDPSPLGYRIFLAALPFVLMALVAVVDLVTGPSLGFLPVLSIGPAIASVSRRPTLTALTGAVGLLLA